MIVLFERARVKGEDNEGRTRDPFMAFETETGTRPNRKASRSEKITGERETHTRGGMDIPGLWETSWSKRTKNKCVWSFLSSSSSLVSVLLQGSHLVHLGFHTPGAAAANAGDERAPAL